MTWPTATLVAMACLGCASAPAPAVRVAPAEPVESQVSKYLPLEHDMVYTYATRVEPGGDQGLLMLRVSRPRPGRVDISVGGRTQRLISDGGGVRHTTGEWLLKQPVQAGQRYPGKSGEIRVESVGKSVRCEDKAYEDCVRTVETSPDTAQTVTTEFCAHVGMVHLLVEMDDSRGYRREEAWLKQFAPYVTIDASDEFAVGH